MRTVKLFNQNIPVREYDCMNLVTGATEVYTKHKLNLFIQVTSKCNANCKFCAWHGSGGIKFDFNKLGLILKELTSREDIWFKKLNFTGGEPTFDIIKFNEVVGCTRDYIKKEDYIGKDTCGILPEITLNTNGVHLLDLISYEKYLDSIGLSRHHYQDAINSIIFGSQTMANEEVIREFQSKVTNKKLVQLRCNVIKGYIDTSEEIENYLLHAINMGVYDCGFVTLMPSNQYCHTHQVNFYNLLKDMQDIIKVNGYKRMENGESVCECGNFVYTDNKGNFCKFYNRYFNHCDLNEGTLVFDGENLRFGFGGSVIF